MIAFRLQDHKCSDVRIKCFLWWQAPPVFSMVKLYPSDPICSTKVTTQWKENALFGFWLNSNMLFLYPMVNWERNVDHFKTLCSKQFDFTTCISWNYIYPIKRLPLSLSLLHAFAKNKLKVCQNQRTTFKMPKYAWLASITHPWVSSDWSVSQIKTKLKL